MKKLFTITALGLVSLQAAAQGPKIIDKDITVAAGTSINLNIQIVDSIRILTWNKSEVSVKGSVNVSDNKDNDKYVVTFDGSSDVFNMKTKLENIDHITSGNKKCNCCCNEVEANFTIYIPENANLTVETINGDITITGKTGSVKAKSISGFVDLAFAPERKAELSLKTITGNMYSDIDLKPAGSKGLRAVGGDISLPMNGGGGGRIE